ncbi:hypothetical protein WJX74_004864 [Apatococcus lobatus]|uniref:Uncharacterized protein n=1 Tax=Apatococcus lobatus TaxID=904363 RepID=A0AAW1QIC2_9CHLO
MVDAMRAALDELMGRERDVPMDRRTNRKLRFDDPEVCKYAIAGLCPYGLFKNTKSDLGDCKYEMHEDDIQFDEIKEEYDMIPEKEKGRYGYPKELFLLLEKLTRDMDKKIERQKERAEKESEPRVLTPDDQRRLDEILGREKEAQRQSEAMAEAGNVDGSMAMATQAESYHSQHDALHKSLTTPERIMTVCDVCGVFINSTDNEQRRQDHLTGKQYLGWKAIRDKHAELRERFAGRAPSGALPPPPPIPEPGEMYPSGPPQYPSDGRNRDRERERERRSRDHERDRERDGERHRHRHHSDRHRDRDGDHYGRESGHREGSHRHHRHRSRSRDQDRDHSLRRRRDDRAPPSGNEIPPPGWL